MGRLPEGTGVLHRSYEIKAESPETPLTAETWVNAQVPEQYRMQIEHRAAVAGMAGRRWC